MHIMRGLGIGVTLSHYHIFALQYSYHTIGAVSLVLQYAQDNICLV